MIGNQWFKKQHEGLGWLTAWALAVFWERGCVKLTGPWEKMPLDRGKARGLKWAKLTLYVNVCLSTLLMTDFNESALQTASLSCFKDWDSQLKGWDSPRKSLHKQLVKTSKVSMTA